METEPVQPSDVESTATDSLPDHEPEVVAEQSAAAGETVARNDALAADAAEELPADRELSGAPEIIRLANILESLLFAAGTAVPLPRLVEALQGEPKADVLAGLRHLAARLDADERGIRLMHVGGAYQLRTATIHGPWVRRLLNAKPPRLSRPMLETLAIVAYRQPCTRVEIEAIRGVDADATLTTLIERRMVRIVGRKEAPGRPILYGTTREFLEIFGLPDLSALPPLPELAEAATLLAARDLTVGGGGVHETAEASGPDAMATTVADGSTASKDASAPSPATAEAQDADTGATEGGTSNDELGAVPAIEFTADDAESDFATPRSAPADDATVAGEPDDTPDRAVARADE